jgi:hypothetical protein
VEFSDFINHCSIVPVAISYEYDPCDIIKAKEVYRSRTNETFRKNPHEDLISILKGINEPKGRVNFTFTPALQGEWKDPKQVAEAVDRAILSSYKLHPTNYIAYDIYFQTDKYSALYSAEDKEKFLRRFNRTEEPIRQTAMEIYARPVINREELSAAK